MRRVLVVLTLLGVVALTLSAAGSGAPVGGAGVSFGKDRVAPIQVVSLTEIERSAVDIQSLRAIGAANVGVFVQATFRGNFEEAIGKGGLEDAGAALILRPMSANARAAGLATTGPGFGNLFRETRSTSIGAYRDGNRVDFFLAGPGYDMVKSVEIRTLRDTSGFGPSTGGTVTPRFVDGKRWDRVVGLPPIDSLVVPADASALTCSELKNLLARVDADLADPYFSRHGSFSVTRSLRTFRSTVDALADKCTTPAPAIRASFVWSRFSANEVAGLGRFTGPATTFDGIRIVLPSGTSITNHLCPAQLPDAVISGNRIDCGGGTLKTGESFKLNLQTLPVPPAGLGGDLFGRVNGTYVGPFDITGP